MVAVDAATGKEASQSKVGDINLGETITMAPIVVKGPNANVIGCCNQFITAATAVIIAAPAIDALGSAHFINFEAMASAITSLSFPTEGDSLSDHGCNGTSSYGDV